MIVYFTKATYVNNIYKISDFYTGNTYKLDPNKRLDILLEASDGTVLTKPTTGILEDNTSVKDYTHMIVPSQNKIYKILSFKYENISQLRMTLQEDALIGNYIELQNKQIYLERTNDLGKFIGLNDIKDMAIKHETSMYPKTNDVNATGAWVLFTFQSDATNLEFEIGEIDNYPSVGSFSNYSELELAFPPVDTSVPTQVPFFLKFATITSTNELYQAVYSDEDGEGVSWVKIHKNPSIQYKTNNVITGLFNKTLYTSGTKISNLGDVSTIQVAFPLDATLVGSKTSTITYQSNTVVVDFSIPSFYNIKNIPNPDKLLGIKIIPQELLGITDIERDDKTRILSVDNQTSGFVVTRTSEIYFSKKITNSNLVDEVPTTQLYNSVQKRIPMYTARQFVDIFEFNTWSYLVDTPEKYEPFHTYYLYFFGELISIPAKYILVGFNVRLAVTATDILYEVYTDKLNVIASGRLQWFARYAVDQLDVFLANNPTFKEQFWTSQIANAIKNIGLGALGGSVSAGPGIGTAIGVTSSIISSASSIMNRHFMEKGLKDKADQIFGQNDVALTMIKGFGVMLVVVKGDAVALNQMYKNYYLLGFPTSDTSTISSLSNTSNSIFGACKIIKGQLLETVKNQFVTNEINTILQQGVILIP